LLGINSDPNLPAVNTITSTDLNPTLLKTTPLSNLLGTRSNSGGNAGLYAATRSPASSTSRPCDMLSMMTWSACAEPAAASGGRGIFVMAPPA
jgi:hypothetical protein